MVLRMRWFFLSLLVVYGWLAPDPLSGDFKYWAWPSTAGLLAGGKQVFGLVLIILAVNLLLVHSRREELLQAIYWLAGPLAWLGLSRSRLALRLVLVLDRVAGVREQAGQVLLEQGTWSRQRWTVIADVAARVFRQALDGAEAMADEDIVFQPLQAPPWYQWLIPVIVIPALFLLPL
jgi:energy-coupling factor transport system permease protein